MHYSKTRNTELSTLKFLEDNLATDWSGVNLVKSWSQLEKVASPVICAVVEDVTYDRKELGNTEFRDSYIFHIDIFATSDGMRIDLADWVMRTLNPGWVFYEASLASGGRTLVYTEKSRCRIDRVIQNERVDLGAFGDVKDKFRQSIIITITVGCYEA